MREKREGEENLEEFRHSRRGGQYVVVEGEEPGEGVAMKSAEEWADDIWWKLVKGKTSGMLVIHAAEFDREVAAAVSAIQAEARSAPLAARPPLVEFQLIESKLQDLEITHQATMIDTGPTTFWETEKQGKIWHLRAVFIDPEDGTVLGRYLASTKDVREEPNRAVMSFAVLAHTYLPALVSDLRSAHALIADMAEDGMTERLDSQIRVRLEEEYQRGFDEGMRASQEEWVKKIREYAGPPIRIGRLPTEEEALLIRQSFEEDDL